MNHYRLVWSYLKAKPLSTALTILPMALGIAVITVLVLSADRLEQNIKDNSKGIDLVVGAKGSPLQLILCNIFHIDFPTGNIKLSEAEKLARNRLVKKAIPLALGDSFQNYRIIGTTRDYPNLYNAKLSTGNWWANNFEVTIGENVANVLKLKIGDSLISSHGLSPEGQTHEENSFVVKGILKSSESVLDNLILTSIESVWKVHDDHQNESTKQEKKGVVKSIVTTSLLVPSVGANDTTREITSLLIQYRGYMAAFQLPRQINTKSNLQAASPAFETKRLFSILGVGVEVIMGFAYLLITISTFSIFIGLYNSIKERQPDLAIMRVMGATRSKLFAFVLLEGCTLTLAGSVVGLLLGHAALSCLPLLATDFARININVFDFTNNEWLILGGSLVLGILCSLAPGVQSYKTDIHKVLSGAV